MSIIIVLLNLDLIRKDHKYYELLSMYKYYKKLNNNDQTIITLFSKLNNYKINIISLREVFIIETILKM